MAPQNETTQLPGEPEGALTREEWERERDLVGEKQGSIRRTRALGSQQQMNKQSHLLQAVSLASGVWFRWKKPNTDLIYSRI